MTARAKSITIITGMFLIGIVVGVLATTTFYQNRFRKIAQLRTRDGFVHNVESVIQPKDSAQGRVIHEIIVNAADSIINNNRARRTRFASLINGLSSRVSPLLDEQQRSRFDEWVEDIHAHERRMERRERGQ